MKKRRALLDATHPVIKSPEAWTKLGGQADAGKGFKIAIIDSGIQPANPMFSDDGFEPVIDLDTQWLNANPDYCRATDGDPGFCNNKIIVARVFEPAQQDFPFSAQSTDYTPLDDNRHGTHVAGIAAGNPIQVTFEEAQVTLSGVAPGAYLMVYKALFDEGGYVLGTDGMLLKALEFAVNDGADVINNSWGSIRDEDPEDSVFAGVFKVAEEMGVVIVSSAGNSGSIGGNAINCPGCIESGITVANSAHGRVFGHKLIAGDTEIASSAGANPQYVSDMSLPVRSLKPISEQTQNGCLSFAEQSFSDMAVLVEYNNNCPVDTIAQHAKDAGAKAVLIYLRTMSYFDDFKPFSQFTVDSTIPVLGIRSVDGDFLESYALTDANTVQISATREALTIEEMRNQLNPGSSTGPNTNPGVLKPDITAPGTDILSAAIVKDAAPFPFKENYTQANMGQMDDIEFALISGTSMSSPAVAGAAALVKQANPSWSAKQIKTALTSTAKPVIKVDQMQASPFEQGAGLVQIDKAMDASLTFSASSHANGACVGMCSFTNDVTLMSGAEGAWDVSVNLDQPNAAYAISQDTIEFGSNGSGAAELELSINTSAVERGTWVFGSIDFTRDGVVENHIPIAVYANDNSDTRELSSNLSLNDNGNISAITRVRNLNLASVSTLSIKVPENANIIESSIFASVSSGASDQLELDEQGNLTWSGTLSKGSMNIAQIEALDIPTLKSAGTQPILCSNGCSDFISYVDFSFEFDGQQYDAITISSNGFALPGRVSLEPFESNRILSLPNSEPPNSVIAPLWNNYDLDDPDIADDSGSGEIYVGSLTIDNSNFLVIEWNNVGRYGSSEEEDGGSTFQLLIKENSDEILFNYIQVPGFADATIGAENSDATVGVTYHNGRDVIALPAPIVSTPVTLMLTSNATGMVDVSYEIEPQQTLTVNTISDKVELPEDTSLAIDVLANDIQGAPMVVSANLNDGNREIKTERLITLPRPQLEPGSLDISASPTNGSVSVNNGVIEYVPDANYFGEDLFEYRITNESGEVSSSTPVYVSVTAVNDSPVIQTISDQTVNSGASVTITAIGEDADGDALSWQWQQTSGPQVSFSGTNNTLTFEAPSVTSQSTLGFSVKALDSSAESATEDFSVTVRPDSENSRSSGGGSLFYILSLLVVTALFRSKQR